MPDKYSYEGELRKRHVKQSDGSDAEVVATLPLELPAGARPEIGDVGATAFVRSTGKSVKCAAGTSTVLKTIGNGAKGDWLVRLIFVVTDNTTATVAVTDGDGSMFSDGTPNAWNAQMVRPANASYYHLDLDQESFNGPWTVTCGAGVTVIAQGHFA